MVENLNPIELAHKIIPELQAIPVQNTPNLRTIRQKYSRMLKKAPAKFVLDLATELFRKHEYRWIAFELISIHDEASKNIGEVEIEKFGQDINSWGAVDAFAGLLAGPAWRNGQISDELIHQWAHSEDRWWRRAALVCTVILNRRSAGGTGDVPRTLEICRLLADDKDEMVVKAMSWALRELIPHDAEAVREFIHIHADVLASRVKREVNNKLTTGLKNPKLK